MKSQKLWWCNFCGPDGQLYGLWLLLSASNVALRTEKLLDLTYVKRIAHATVLRMHSEEEKEAAVIQVRYDKPTMRPGSQKYGNQNISVIVGQNSVRDSEDKSPH